MNNPDDDIKLMMAKYGRWMITLGEDMISNPNRYYSVTIGHEPNYKTKTNEFGLTTDVEIDWESIHINVRRNH